MPGLAGLISKTSEHELFSAMQASLNHRKYQTEQFARDGIHVAHVNHLHSETEVIHSADKRLTVALHGTVFSARENFRETYDRGASLLLELFKNNFQFLTDINGQFCAFIHDHATGTSFLISDRFNTQPIYYSVHKQRLIFAPEVKAILKDSFEKRLDYHAIGEMFSFGHLHGNKTLFEGIYRLPAASVLTFYEGKATFTEYWSLPYDEDTYQRERIKPRKAQLFAEELSSIFVAATKRQDVEAEKLLIPLSGGLDSRYAAALYHHIGKRNVSLYTMGPEKSEDQIYATQVAEKLNFNHTKFEINAGDIWSASGLFSFVSDGMSNISGSVQNFEPLRTFASTKHVLSASQMCDALFGSTLSRKRVRILQENQASRAITDEILVNLFRTFNQQQVKLLFRPEAYMKMDGRWQESPRAYCTTHFHPLHNYFRLLLNEKVRRGTLGGNISINLFYRMQMLSYDNDVFQFGWKLPIAYREYQNVYRKSFSLLFPELAKIRRQGANLPIDASNARFALKNFENKIGVLALKSPLAPIAKLYRPWSRPTYVSYRQWFRHELKQDLIQFLTKEKLKSASLLRPEAVQTLLQNHITGKEDNTAILWQVINLEYVFRNFID